jgi:YtoQ family protein
MIKLDFNKFGGIMMELTVYLAGQIHDAWREEMVNKAKEKNLPLVFVGPQTNHDRSDQIGEEILGKQPGGYYKDDAASDINNLRTQVLLQKADIVIALFGEKYKQWNTAMDASTAIAMNKPTIIIRPESLIHPLKELSNKANVTVETIDQALDVISYIYE